MNADRALSRRGFAAGLVWLGLGGARALAQGFAGLGGEAGRFAAGGPGPQVMFPHELRAHPDLRLR